MATDLTDEELDEILQSFTVSTQLSDADEMLEKLMKLPRKKKKKQRAEIQRLREIIQICLKMKK
jgi:hypothetical protein